MIGTKHADLFAALAAPFAKDEVKKRSQAGREFHYITARHAMNRLDQVLGPENWWDEFTPGADSVMCRLTIRLPDGTILAKADAGGYAGMADSGDDDKSGFSDAFKRAAVKFGVARYLYKDGVPQFVRDVLDGRASDNNRPGDAGGDPEPSSPSPSRPPAGQGRDEHPPTVPMGNGRPSGRRDSQPRTGRALFAWTKDQEQRHEVGLLRYLNDWAKLQDFPGRMVDWDAEMVALAYAEASRKIASIGGNHSDDNPEALAN